MRSGRRRKLLALTGSSHVAHHRLMTMGWRLVIALLAAMLGAGCSESDKPAGPAGPARVMAENYCFRSGDRLSFQALFPVRYTKTASGRQNSRQLYQFDCSLSGQSCEGLQFKLDNIDDGKPLGMMDLGGAKGAEVVSATGDVIVIKWGVFRTFTVDLSRDQVMYTESGEGAFGPVDGRGEVSCKAAMR